MTTLLMVAVLLLCGMALWCVKIISSSPNPNSTPAWAFAGASVLLSLKIIVQMLQTEFARRDLKAEAVKTRHDLKGELHVQAMRLEEVAQKTNGGLTKAVQEVGEQVRQAEREQLISDPRCFEAVEKAIEKAADLAATKAEQRMRVVIAEMRGGSQ